MRALGVGCEKNLNKVEERYRAIAEKNAKLEESVSNLVKRVDELYVQESNKI